MQANCKMLRTYSQIVQLLEFAPYTRHTATQAADASSLSIAKQLVFHTEVTADSTHVCKKLMQTAQRNLHVGKC